jgi:hypothetical protein
LCLNNVKLAEVEDEETVNVAIGEKERGRI